jgi:hypothetical protein
MRSFRFMCLGGNTQRSGLMLPADEMIGIERDLRGVLQTMQAGWVFQPSPYGYCRVIKFSNTLFEV